MIKKIFFLIILILIISIGIFYFKPSKDIDNRKKFTFWSIQLKPVYEKEILKIIDEFEKNHPDYKVVWVDIPIQEAQKRTLASVLSSNPPDLVNLNPDFSILLAQKGILEFFNEDDLKDYNKNILNKLKYQNKIYAVPFYATSPVTIYNKELFDKCFNKKFPYTYSELFKISPEIKACTNITPYLASINENDTFSKILNKFGIYSFNSDEKKNKAFEALRALLY